MQHENLSLKSIVERNADVLFNEVANGLSLMDIETGKYFHYNQNGSYIWKNLDRPTKIGSLCLNLEKTFEVDRKTCQTDTLEFLDELSRLGLIVVR